MSVRKMTANWLVKCWVIVLTAGLAHGKADFPPHIKPTTRIQVGISGIYPARRWCISEGVPLKKLPDQQSATVGALSYLEIVFVAEGIPPKPRAASDSRDKDEEWCLVVTNNENDQLTISQRRGWVQRKYLLEQERPEIDLESFIAKKACVVVPTKYAKELLHEKRRPEPLIPRLAPRAGPPSDFKVLLYELFFIYGELEGELLIGRRNMLDANQNTSFLRDNLIGWIPADRVARWNTRECLEWNRTNAGSQAIVRRPIPGVMFLSAEDAFAAYPKISLSNPTGGIPAMIEPRDANGDLLNVRFDRMRFHLLQTAREAQKTKLSRASEWTRPGNELLQLGVTGTYLGPDGQEVAGELVAEQRENLDQLADQVSETEILFVIDDTESMVDWFGRVAEIVREIVADIKQQALNKDSSGGRVRAAVTFYNDAPKSEDAVDFGVLVDLGTEAGANFLIRRLKHNVHQNPNDLTPLEQVAMGISIGIDEAGFQPQTRKMVVLLGDCGDKHKDPKLDDILQGIARRLIPRDAGLCEFHAIHVVNPALNADYKAFRQQFDVTLRKHYSERLKEMFIQYNNRPNAGDLFTYTENARDARSVADVILPKFHRAREAGAKYRKVFTKTSLEGLGAEVVNMTDPVLQRMFDQEGVGQFVSNLGIQPYEIVYAWENCPLKSGNQQLKQLRRRVLISEKELDQAVGIINTLETKIRSNGYANALEIVQKLLEEQAGNTPDFLEGFENKERSRAMIKGLRFQSDMFRTFVESGVSRFNREQFSRLLVTAQLLNDIRKNQLAEPDKYEVIQEIEASIKYDRCARKRDPDTKEEYPRLPDQRSILRNKTNWYYIDFETEWP